ncbi:SDR family oxidoreductase [Rhodococcus sp. NPDC056960]|uniref:SDR family oxidoreductase n=1 Tax=Rhodococcus TaxID=1827 RepID=UPI00363491C0
MSRTYVVTGSASGIGRATKNLLEERGERVIGVDIKSADVEADLSTPDGRERMISQVGELSDGEIDAVLAVAGLSAPTSLTARVNYFGTLATLTGLRPLLARSAAPRAVAVSSFALIWPGNEDLYAAFQADDEDRAVEIADSIAGGVLGGPIYNTAKWALASWVRRMAPMPEWAGEGIALNAIAPGLIATPMTAGSLDNAEARKASLEAIPMPLNGPAEPVVVARLLAWLAGVENSHLCGQIIFVDGGAEATKRGDSILTLDGTLASP